MALWTNLRRFLRRIRPKSLSFAILGTGVTLDLDEIRAGDEAVPDLIGQPTDLGWTKAYTTLIGREDEVTKVTTVLRNPNSVPVVAIVGLGGMGKTALACEVAQQLEGEELFERIVPIGVTTDRFVDEDDQKIEISDYSLDKLLDDVGYQCGRPAVAQQVGDAKVATVRKLLTAKRTLIVLDNFETISVTEQRRILAGFLKARGHGRLLITSRLDVEHDQAMLLRLGGISDREAGIRFLRVHATDRNIEWVAKADRSDLEEIFDVTGGAPLAMRVVVGQLNHHTLDVVLANLRKVSFGERNERFYNHLFRFSYEGLGEDAKKLLSALRHFHSGAREDHLEAVAAIDGPVFQTALSQLNSAFFVDTVGDLRQRRVVLHPLVKYFIEAELVEKWI